MRYSLNLADDGRILSVTYEKYAPGGAIVTSLPDGRASDYKYINGQYVYEPLPRPIPPLFNPNTPDDVSTDAKLAQMQAQIDALLEGRTG